MHLKAVVCIGQIGAFMPPTMHTDPMWLFDCKSCLLHSRKQCKLFVASDHGMSAACVCHVNSFASCSIGLTCIRHVGEMSWSNIGSTHHPVGFLNCGVLLSMRQFSHTPQRPASRDHRHRKKTLLIVWTSCQIEK